ncbi:MAG TPA: hypothetical protein VHY36_07980 [Steroidobacteraceae bacterium]|nr:hypothetical protein [Steroidobacteraceae bacterium]
MTTSGLRVAFGRENWKGGYPQGIAAHFRAYLNSLSRGFEFRG